MKMLSMTPLNNKDPNIDPGLKTLIILFHILYQERIFTLFVREIMCSSNKFNPNLGGLFRGAFCGVWGQVKLPPLSKTR